MVRRVNLDGTDRRPPSHSLASGMKHTSFLLAFTRHLFLPVHTIYDFRLQLAVSCEMIAFDIDYTGFSAGIFIFVSKSEEKQYCYYFWDVLLLKQLHEIRHHTSPVDPFFPDSLAQCLVQR